jgi:hypothetical protein
MDGAGQTRDDLGDDEGWRVMRQRWRRGRVGGRAGSAAVAALWTVAAIGGQAPATAAESPDGPAAYRTADKAQPRTGADSSAEGPELRPGGIYTDTIGPGQKLWYSVGLDAESHVFLSAVAAPRPLTAVAYGDGISVTLQSNDGTACGTGGDRTFGSGEQARPIADYADRTIQEDAACQTAGPYYLLLERTGEPGADPARWPVEIRYMQEPGVRGGSTAPPTEGSWSSASPTPATGQARDREGGTGFNDAPALTDGVWRDRLTPGETRFYRVPLDWGQQLYAGAELAAATMTKDSGYASSGLRMELYNTARGYVDDVDTSYDGKQQATAIGPTAPVAYHNRFDDIHDDVSAMRFAGWYYLAVSLSPEVGQFTTGTVPLTLRLRIEGRAESGPRYEGDAIDAGFGVTDDDREAAEEGRTAAESGQSATLKLLGTAGIGAGTVLLLGLGAWTLAARRRASAGAAVPPVPDGALPPHQGEYGRSGDGGQLGHQAPPGRQDAGIQGQPGQAEPRFGPPAG